MHKIDNYTEFIRNNTLRLVASSRGGGIEVNCSEAVGIEGAKMSAYQNYLGGGLLGSIEANHNIKSESLNKKQRKALAELASELCKYFHNVTNPSDSEWESATFAQLQNRPVSAY